MLQTREDSVAWVALPRAGGRLDLAPGTSVEVSENWVRLVRGEIRVRVPPGAGRELQVETPRGRLRVGPGGVVRVRPKGFARLEGPVEKAG
jgi:ferric-dicitrate binding protein FerR (iron transport regulator)